MRISTRSMKCHAIHPSIALLWIMGSMCFTACTSPASTPAVDGPRIIFALPHTISFTKDGKHLAVGERLGGVEHKNCVRVYDVTSRDQKMKFPVVSYSMAMSPSNDEVFTGFVGAGFIVWDPILGKEIRQLEFEGSGPGKFAFSRDGALLAYGCLSGFISVYDAKSDKRLCKVEAHEGKVLALAFSPNDKSLVSSSDQSLDVRVWNTSDLKMVHSITEARLDVPALAFSPDGAFLVTASHDFRIRVYDAAKDFKLLGSLSHDSIVRDVAFSKDGTLASCSHDNTVRLWNVRDRKEIKRLTLENGDLGKLAFSPTDDVLAIALPPRLIFWNYKTGEQHEIRHSPGLINGIALPNDETFELPDPTAKSDDKPPRP